MRLLVVFGIIFLVGGFCFAAGGYFTLSPCQNLSLDSPQCAEYLWEKIREVDKKLEGVTSSVTVSYSTLKSENDMHTSQILDIQKELSTMKDDIYDIKMELLRKR